MIAIDHLRKNTAFCMDYSGLNLPHNHAEMSMKSIFPFLSIMSVDIDRLNAFSFSFFFIFVRYVQMSNETEISLNILRDRACKSHETYYYYQPVKMERILKITNEEKY